MIYVKNWSGQVLKARCKYCEHCCRSLKGQRVDYMGVCYHKAPLSTGILAQPIGLSNLACDNFSPQPSFTKVEYIQTKLF